NSTLGSFPAASQALTFSASPDSIQARIGSSEGAAVSSNPEAGFETLHPPRQKKAANKKYEATVVLSKTPPQSNLTHRPNLPILLPAARKLAASNAMNFPPDLRTIPTFSSWPIFDILFLAN